MTPTMLSPWLPIGNRPASSEAGQALRRREAAYPDMRVYADVLEAFKATGQGWQTRINAALRKAVAHGLTKA
jgi:uncharacterized protein (DUF4415 family)